MVEVKCSECGQTSDHVYLFVDAIDDIFRDSDDLLVVIRGTLDDLELAVENDQSERIELPDFIDREKLLARVKKLIREGRVSTDYICPQCGEYIHASAVMFSTMRTVRDEIDALVAVLNEHESVHPLVFSQVKICRESGRWRSYVQAVQAVWRGELHV